MSVLEVTDSNFNSQVLTAGKICIVDFWAPWCGPCKMMAPVFEQVSTDITDVKFVKINIDENQQYPSEFGVMSIPTFIAFKGGKKISTKVGGMTKEALSTWVKSLS